MNKHKFSVKQDSIQLINLGLSSGTLWADRNLGANCPEGYGEYFRFGETTPFVENSSEYEYKKLPESIAGTKYDAATFIFGKGFAMPTFNQFTELIKECRWEWITVNGINGKKVTGPNGNYVFLPASGYRGGSLKLLKAVNVQGFYSTAMLGDMYRRHYLFFCSRFCNYHMYYNDIGFTVRPVAKTEST